MGQCDNVQSASLQPFCKLKTRSMGIKLWLADVSTDPGYCLESILELVQERLYWFNDLCMSSAKGMGQCDNVQSALQAQDQELVQDRWVRRRAWGSATTFNQRACTKTDVVESSAKGMGQCDNVQSALQAQDQELVQDWWPMSACGEGHGAVRQRSISNVTESSNGDKGVV